MPIQTGDIISEITAMPQVAEIKNNIGTIVPKLLPSVLDDIAHRYDWDFMIREYSTTTVANQAEYTITGLHDDVGDIIQIRYGDNAVVQHMRRLDAHDLVANNGTVNGVYFWYQSGVDTTTGCPKVTLVDTPSEAKTLKVLYRENAVDLVDFPLHFQGLIVNAILMRLGVLAPPLWEKQLKEKIHRHKVGGKDYNPATIDPHMAWTQRKISNLYGTG